MEQKLLDIVLKEISRQEDNIVRYQQQIGESIIEAHKIKYRNSNSPIDLAQYKVQMDSIPYLIQSVDESEARCDSLEIVKTRMIAEISKSEN